MVLVHEVGFVAVRRSPLPFFCSPTSMNPPGCQLFEFRARKMRYEPSRAILQRAPLNLWIALIPHRFEMVSMLVAFRLSTEPLVPSSKGRFETIQPLSSRSIASWEYLAVFLSNAARKFDWESQQIVSSINIYNIDIDVQYWYTILIMMSNINIQYLVRVCFKFKWSTVLAEFFLTQKSS